MNHAIFQSSGDLIADRRYALAQDLAGRGDFAAAIDLLRQTVEIAPRFTAAWFLLGDWLERSGDSEGAIAAFATALQEDREDRHGAALRLQRLGAGSAGAMPPGYVRALFDQYATRFDQALTQGLHYRAPQLSLAAVERVCRDERRAERFATMLDLGCGTGLTGAVFRPRVGTLVGVDLSAGMIAQARAKGVYDRLDVAELGEYLRSPPLPEASCDLVTAADVFVYLADLASVFADVTRLMQKGGLFAFTVESHPGAGVILRETLRYAHGAETIEAWIRQAGLHAVLTEPASTRTENGADVEGLLIVARKP